VTFGRSVVRCEPAGKAVGSRRQEKVEGSVIGRNLGPTQVTPPAIRSSLLRTVLVGLLVVAVPVALVGCKGRTPPTAEPTADLSTEAPSESATPHVTGQTLVTLAGTGDQTSDPFQASGESVDVKYSYTCTEPSSFTLSFYGTNGSAALPDILIDDFGAQGEDEILEPLNGADGPFHFDVVSQCDWSVTVSGTP
jgi:hypothetical protein